MEQSLKLFSSKTGLLTIIWLVTMFQRTISSDGGGEIDFDCFRTEINNNTLTLPKVVVIGTTGVGKSTFANYISGVSKGKI